MQLASSMGMGVALLIATAWTAPLATAPAGGQRDGDETRWSQDSHGKPYPVEGWKSCAEALAHTATPVMRGEPGYNPALDPAGSGIECA